MHLYDDLTQILADARNKSRHVRIIDGDKDETLLSFAELWDRAVNLLGDLQRRGMQPGDELIIFTRSNESFLVAFWAAILGGIVPVPVAVGISDEHRFKLFRIVSQMRRGTLFTESDLLMRLKDFARNQTLTDIGSKLENNSLTDRAVDPDLTGSLVSVDPQQTAFIQYSSGSTSDPKGVCLTHANLTHNIRAIVEGAGWHKDDQSLSWMPLTHDMGLIGYHLSVLAAGMNHAVMDTNVFVRRPLLWMSKASELGATQLCSPNFGYKHFLKLFERKGVDNLDLSAVRLILNGAEPISWELCEAFLDALAPHGLMRSAMFPVYGLAEATVGVTFPELGSEMDRITVDRHKLRIGAPYETKNPDDPDAVSFVKVGRPIRDCEIRIVGDDDVPLPEGIVGHIQVQGASVTQGLYDNAEAEAALFTSDRWLRTGDCGVIVGGDLVITGRSKDIIIVNGQNYYPHDIEEVIARIDGLDLGKVVVAGVSSDRTQAEEMLVFVLFRQDVGSFHEVAAQVRDIVGEQVGLEIDHVIPVNRIPKTTSGKVQRSQLANAYLQGEFDTVLREMSSAKTDGADDLDDDPLVREIELICREFSRERRIGPDDNLFEVGVSSLTLTEIVLAVEEKHPGKVDISDLFDYPTIRELAEFIRR
jgi:acyl-CoA synthetase (AMP-forming)/AMP-acid ligase II/acyl carrier protein